MYEGRVGEEESRSNKRAEEAALIYYYTADLQSAWKVSALCALALNKNAMVIVEHIKLRDHPQNSSAPP